MDLVARLKSVAANLIIGALSTLAAVFIYLNVWVPLNFVFGFVLALWGLLHVYRAVTFKLEPKFLPHEQPIEAKIAAQHAGEVERDNRRAITEWVWTMHPGWPDHSHARFVDFMSTYFRDSPWDGDPNTSQFGDAIDAYVADWRRDHP